METKSHYKPGHHTQYFIYHICVTGTRMKSHLNKMHFIHIVHSIRDLNTPNEELKNRNYLSDIVRLPRERRKACLSDALRYHYPLYPIKWASFDRLVYMLGFFRVRQRESVDMLRSILLFAVLVLQVLCNHKFAGR